MNDASFKQEHERNVGPDEPGTTSGQSRDLHRVPRPRGAETRHGRRRRLDVGRQRRRRLQGRPRRRGVGVAAAPPAPLFRRGAAQQVALAGTPTVLPGFYLVSYSMFLANGFPCWHRLCLLLPSFLPSFSFKDRTRVSLLVLVVFVTGFFFTEFYFL